MDIVGEGELLVDQLNNLLDVVGASLHSRLGSGRFFTSSFLACAGEKLPEIAVWGAVGEWTYVRAETDSKVGCRKYQVDP